MTDTDTKLELLRGASVLDISEATNYGHEMHDGFGMAPLHRMTERGPLQHGVTDRGYRLDPRTVDLVITVQGYDWTEQYLNRRTLLDFLTPVGDEPITLRFTLPDASIKQLDTYLVSGPTFGTRDLMCMEMIRGVFSLYAPDPSWYNPTVQSMTFSIGAGGTGYIIPLVIPYTVGASSINVTQTIVYGGTWISYPHIIRITGPIANPIITNLSTNEKLDFTGTTIAGGDYYDIDLRYGYKTVKDASGTNQLSKLTADSDLATWHLAPSPEAAGGGNPIRVTGSSATAATAVQISYYVRYIGI